MFNQSRSLGALALLISVSAASSALAESGDLLWQFQTNGSISGGLEVNGDAVYFGSDDGHLYALDVTTRELNWKFSTSAMVRSAPAFYGRQVLFTSDDGYLYSVDKHNGERLWQFDLQDGQLDRYPPAAYAPWEFDWGKSSPVTIGNRVYVGSADGHLYAIDARDGSLLWKFQAADRVRGTPVVHGNWVYFSSWDHNVYALDATTGNLRWKQSTGDRIVSSPAYIEGKIIIGSRDANLYTWNAKTGEQIWNLAYSGGSWVESSAVAGETEGTFFIGSSDARKLFKFNTNSGAEVWSFSTTGWTWGTPRVANGTVYIGSTGVENAGRPIDGGFFAVDAQSGELRWSYQPAKSDAYLSGGVLGTPAVVGGQVFVGDLDGTVYVFEE